MVEQVTQKEEFMGHPYNYDKWHAKQEEYPYFKSVIRAGDMAPDFTLPTLDGGEVRLSSLRGKPVVMEFGSIT